MTPSATQLGCHGPEIADPAPRPREPSEGTSAQVSEADLGLLAAALSALLLATWRRHEQAMADGSEPSAGEGVRADAAVTRSPE
jgi:hypothetical protein